MIVAFMLTTHDGRNGCYPSIQTLADECGLAKNHTYVALTALEKRGFFVRRIDEAGRAHFDLQPYPKVVELRSRADTKSSPTSGSKESHTGTRFSPTLGPLYKVREQTNRTDHEQTQVQAPICPETEEPSISSKIVSAITRHTPSPVSAGPPPPRRKRSAREKTFSELASWFSQTCFAPLDTSTRELQSWNWLLTRYADSAVTVQAVCKEAFSRRNELLTKDFPVWGLQTVIFYVKFKRPEAIPEDHEKVLKLHVLTAVRTKDFSAAREYVAVHGLSEQAVRRIVVHDDLVDILHTTAISGSKR